MISLRPRYKMVIGTLLKGGNTCTCSIDYFILIYNLCYRSDFNFSYSFVLIYFSKSVDLQGSVTKKDTGKTTVMMFLHSSTSMKNYLYFSRFFKIFPLLGQHQVGLQKYGRYLCSQVCVMILLI